MSDKKEVTEKKATEVANVSVFEDDAGEGIVMGKHTT